MLNHMKRSWHEIRKIVFTLLGAVVVLMLLNYDFVLKNIEYFFTKPEPPKQVEQQVKLEEPNKLVISSLNLDLPIAYVDKVSESDFQAALKTGVVHYPGTALPGQSGNAYIFGHSSDYIWVKSQYKSAFATLPHIQVGDIIHIT